MKTIGLIPGSFNPVHAGHTYLALEGLDTYQLDEIRFIPAYQNPFKSPYELSFDQRCELIRIHIESAESHNQAISRKIGHKWGEKTISVWRIEETLKKIKEKMGDNCNGNYFFEVAEWISNLEEYNKHSRFVLLFGEDILFEFHQWIRPSRISRLFDIIFIKRMEDHGEAISSTNMRKVIEGKGKPDAIVAAVYNKINKWGVFNAQ